MGCCCSASALPILTIDLPTGEVMRLPAPKTFSTLVACITAKIPQAQRIKIHAEDGELTETRYPLFLKRPSRLLVEALDISPTKTQKSHKSRHRNASQPESNLTLDTPKETEFLLDVEKGKIHIISTASMTVSTITSDKIQWESRAAVVGGKVVVTGGRGNGRMCVEVQMNRDRVRNCTEMMEGRESHSVAVLDGNLYVIGGYASQEMRSCEVLTNNEWFPASNLQRCRSFHASLAYQGWIYACGGTKESTIESFDGKEWRLLQVQLPIYVSRIGMCAMPANTVLLTGGETLKGGHQTVYSTETFLLDTESEELKKGADLPRAGCFTQTGGWADHSVLFFADSVLYIYSHDQWQVQVLA